MAISLKHATQAVGEDAGNGEIRKAQWNADHSLTMATGRILGRLAAGDGDVQEIQVAGPADIRSMSGDKVLLTRDLDDAAALIFPDGAVNWSPDWASFLSASWVITASRTLVNPTNVIPGTTRVIRIASSATTARAISYGTAYRGQGLPASVTNTSVALLTLFAVSPTEIAVVGVGYTT